MCHPQCSSDGCWGSGPDHCLECQNFTLEGECVETCDSSQGIYQDSPTECKRCDPECFGTCTGQVSLCRGGCVCGHQYDCALVLQVFLYVGVYGCCYGFVRLFLWLCLDVCMGVSQYTEYEL